MKKEKENKHIIFKIFAIIIIIITITFLYARYINTKGLTIKEIPIYDTNLPTDYNGFKIAHFSDIHFGRTTNEQDLKKVVKEINNLNADIVIFTGDLFDKKNITQKEVELFTKHLSEINAKLFKFAVPGDYDLDYLNTYINILNASNFIYLDNSSKLIYQNSSSPLNIIGLKNIENINKLYNNSYYNITLIHKPDLASSITNTNLVFAGHSLGGQIKIPFIGGLRKKEGAKTYTEEFYQLDNTKLYISNGIGTEDFSFRSFNKPSITLYRLYNS